jgi:hypothetical protein
MPIASFLVRDSTVQVRILREVTVQEGTLRQDMAQELMDQELMDQEVMDHALMVLRANHAAMVQTLPGRLK